MSPLKHFALAAMLGVTSASTLIQTPKAQAAETRVNITANFVVIESGPGAPLALDQSLLFAGNIDTASLATPTGTEIQNETIYNGSLSNIFVLPGNALLQTFSSGDTAITNDGLDPVDGAFGDGIALRVNDVFGSQELLILATDGTFTNPDSSINSESLSEIFNLDQFDVLLATDANNSFIAAGIFELTPLNGDYNNDGTVDAADYTVWRDALGQPVSQIGQGADGNHNGVVDHDDYNVWTGTYGQTIATPLTQDFQSSVISTAVPEPSNNIPMFLLGGAILAATQRRRSEDTDYARVEAEPLSFY